MNKEIASAITKLLDTTVIEVHKAGAEVSKQDILNELLTDMELSAFVSGWFMAKDIECHEMDMSNLKQEYTSLYL